MFSLERRKFGGKWPSVVVGAFLGLFAVLLVGSLFLPSLGRAASLCDGRFPCFTTAACAKAGGDFASCPAKCPGPGARGYCFARQESIPLTIRIGGTASVVDLGAYIEAVYRYAVAVAGIFAAVMLMIGGIQWLTAGGDSGRVGSAKTRIMDALVGLALTLFAWLILNTINPALVRLQMPRIPMVREQSFVRCEILKMSVACGQEFAIAENAGVAEDAPPNERYRIVSRGDAEALTDCVGASCSLAGSVDGTNTCQRLTEGQTPSGQCSGCASGYDCRPCTQAGQACEAAGIDSSCCGGYCSPAATSIAEVAGAGGEGTTGSITLTMFRQIEEGVSEYTPDWYRSMLNRMGVGMPSDFGFVCNNGRLGRPCLIDAECQSDKCVMTDGSPLGGSCQNGAVGAVCAEDADCNGMACVESSCTPRVRGGYCEDDGDCPGGATCINPGDGKAKYCAGDIQSSIDRLNGNECGERGSQASFCGRNMRCDSVDAKYRCITGELGTACTDDRHCRDINGTQLGTCYMGAFDNESVGVCVSPAPGSGCDISDLVHDCDRPREQGGTMVCYPVLSPDNSPNASETRGVCLGHEQNDPCVKAGSLDSCVTSLTNLVCPEGSYTCISQSGQ